MVWDPLIISQPNSRNKTSHLLVAPLTMSQLLLISFFRTETSLLPTEPSPSANAGIILKELSPQSSERKFKQSCTLLAKQFVDRNWSDDY